MNIREHTKRLLEENGIKPNKVLGQNFLVEEDVIDYFIEKCAFKKNESVIEVGAGLGGITKKLAKTAETVYAVEKDPDIFQLLKKEVEGIKNIKPIKEDILETDIGNLVGGGEYRVAGSPPYYLTGRLFRTFLENTPNKPNQIDLIIQKEVAEKAARRAPKNSLLSVSVQLYGDVKLQKTVPKNFFWPPPNVDSAILTIENISSPKINEKRFFFLVKASFSSPRKQLGVNIANNYKVSKNTAGKILRDAKIEPRRRAETLSIEDWINILKIIEGGSYGDKTSLEI